MLTVLHCEELYSFRNKNTLNSPIRTVAVRTFIGSCATLSASVINISVLVALEKEPAWMCLMMCNADSIGSFFPSSIFLIWCPSYINEVQFFLVSLFCIGSPASIPIQRRHRDTILQTLVQYLSTAMAAIEPAELAEAAQLNMVVTVVLEPSMSQMPRYMIGIKNLATDSVRPWGFIYQRGEMRRIYWKILRWIHLWWRRRMWAMCKWRAIAVNMLVVLEAFQTKATKDWSLVVHLRIR